MTGLIVAAVLVPVLSGLLVLIVGERWNWPRGIFAFLVTATTLVLFGAAWAGLGSGVHRLWLVTIMRSTPEPLLLVDFAGVLLAVLFAFVWLVVTLYSLSYMKASQFQADYYGFLLLMLGTVVGVCQTDNLLLIYVFWELAALATWRLVAFYRGDQEIGIAQMTLLVNFVGSTLMLVGFAGIAQQYGTFSIGRLSGVGLSPVLSLLILAGMVTKSASLPMYIWLPDAHSAAPSPMSALLSGIVAKIGLVAYLRLFVQGHVLLPSWWPLLVAGLGVAGSLVAAGCALRETDYKRVLAFSTVSQLGYIFIGFAFATGFGLTAGFVYLAAHCLAKSGLFLSMGIVERATHTREMGAIRGLARAMPTVAAAVAVLMVSVIGLPPLLGFFGKLYVIIAAARENLLVAAGAVVAAVMTAIYMLRVFRMFLGEPRPASPGRPDATMALAVLVLAVVTLALGLCYPFYGGALSSHLSGSMP